MISKAAVYTALVTGVLAVPPLMASPQDVPRALAMDSMRHAQAKPTINLVVKRKSIEGNFPWERIEVPESDLQEFVHELLADPDVLAVEQEQVFKRPDPTPDQAFSVMSAYVNQAVSGLFYNDPEFHQQHIFQSHQNGTDMRLLEAHERLASGRNVRVGVLDTGFYLSNDFTYHEGYNLYQPRGASFLNGAGGLCSGDDRVTDHGTLVSSVLAATPDNSLGIAGAAPNVELI